jgi:uncharacterized C2H2 Zn-finger protein
LIGGVNHSRASSTWFFKSRKSDNSVLSCPGCSTWFQSTKWYAIYRKKNDITEKKEAQKLKETFDKMVSSGFLVAAFSRFQDTKSKSDLSSNLNPNWAPDSSENFEVVLSFSML